MITNHMYSFILSCQTVYCPHCLGKGALVIYEEQAAGAGGLREFREARHWLWKDGLFDVTWSEVNEAVLVAGSGDGSLLVVDQSRPPGSHGQLEPAGVLVGHSAEASTWHSWGAAAAAVYVVLAGRGIEML